MVASIAEFKYLNFRSLSKTHRNGLLTKRSKVKIKGTSSKSCLCKFGVTLVPKPTPLHYSTHLCCFFSSYL